MGCGVDVSQVEEQRSLRRDFFVFWVGGGHGPCVDHESECFVNM